MIKKLHLVIGMVGMLLFLLSGQYFALAMNGLQDLADTPRLLLRTSHVYFFFACIINVVFGFYYVAGKWPQWYEWTKQSLVMLSPLLLAYGFVVESFDNPGIEREVGIQGVIILFVWFVVATGEQIITHWVQRRDR